jgi:hypothetical protein
VPQPEEILRPCSRVIDNLDFIQTRFHVSRFVTTAVDTEADQDNIKALYSSLKNTSEQIDVSVLTIYLIAFPYHGFDSFLS